MLTSKGASGVTGAGFVTLAATLSIVPDIPIQSLALLVGIDKFMNGGSGADSVATRAPDAYTLLATASGPIVVNPVLYATVPYDPVRDFVPVSQGTSYQYVLVALASSPLRGIDDVGAAARARPGAITYGSTGFGGGNHLAGELLALKTHTRLTHVPFKSNPAALAPIRRANL